VCSLSSIPGVTRASRRASQVLRLLREQPEILAVQLDQVEGKQDGIASLVPPVESKTATPSAPQTTASPSRVNARSLAAAPAIAG
jgi:hypothetical protein